MKIDHVYRIAGTGNAASGASDVLATTSSLSTYVASICFDANGNLYFVDALNYSVKMVPRTSGTYFNQTMTANYIYMVAGTGAAGSTSADGTTATSADITPAAVDVDSSGNLYVLESNKVRMVPASDTTLFGVTMQKDKIYTIAGAGTGGFSDGVDALSAYFYGLMDIELDSIGNIIVSDYNNHLVEIIPKTGGTYYGRSGLLENKVYKIAGGGGSLGDGGSATSGSLSYPMGIAVDSNDNLFIADQLHHRVRLVPNHTDSVFGGSRNEGYIYTVAGSGVDGFFGDSLLATSAKLTSPREVALDGSGNLYIADRVNERIRMVPSASGTYHGVVANPFGIYTVAGGGSGGEESIGLGSNLGYTWGIAFDADDQMYMAAWNAIRVLGHCD